MAERPAKTGVEQILNYWDDVNDGSPCFSIWWNSRDKATQYNGKDLDESRERLSRWLDVNNVEGDTSLYYLRIHPDSERAYTWKSPMVESIPFRFNALPDSVLGLAGLAGMGGGGAHGIMYAIKGLNDNIEKKFTTFEARLAAVEDGGGETSPWGIINGIIDNDHMGPVIANIIAGVVAKVTNQPMPQQFQPRPMALAGVSAVSQKIASTANQPAPAAADPDLEFQQQINNALVRLQVHCNLADTLTALANLAETNPAKFKMGLSLLS